MIFEAVILFKKYDYMFAQDGKLSLQLRSKHNLIEELIWIAKNQLVLYEHSPLVKKPEDWCMVDRKWWIFKKHYYVCIE